MVVSQLALVKVYCLRSLAQVLAYNTGGFHGTSANERTFGESFAGQPIHSLRHSRPARWAGYAWQGVSLCRMQFYYEKNSCLGQISTYIDVQ